jgi:hypothetical protein
VDEVDEVAEASLRAAAAAITACPAGGTPSFPNDGFGLGGTAALPIPIHLVVY